MANTMPVLFLGHGSPMNAITHNVWHSTWQKLGARFGQNAEFPLPELILCISAHWETNGVFLTAGQPKTIHDFGGFPPELFAQQYPTPNADAWHDKVKAAISGLDVQTNQVKTTEVQTTTEWGLDHGCWGVLKPMFPAAQIPVMQLSLNRQFTFAEHWQLGEKLASLREQGVLIVGSGDIVHNLRRMNPQQNHPWAVEFDLTIRQAVDERKQGVLVNPFQLGDMALLSIPTDEHYLPLLYIVGASRATDKVEWFNTDIDLGSVSMSSVMFY